MATFSDGTNWSDNTTWTDGTLGGSGAVLQVVPAADAIRNLGDLLGMMDTWSLADADLATKMQAVGMCETEMNDRLRIQLLERRVVIKSSAGGAVLPIDVRAVRQIYAKGARWPLESMEFDQIAALQTWEQAGGDIQSYGINGHVLSFWPQPKDNLELLVWYYGDIQGLNTGNPLNAVLARHPHLYFSGAMKWLESYLQNSDRSAEWGAIFYGGMDALVNRDRADRSGPGPLVGRYGRRMAH